MTDSYHLRVTGNTSAGFMLTLHNSKNNLILSVNKKAVFVVSIKLNKLLCKKHKLNFAFQFKHVIE